MALIEVKDLGLGVRSRINIVNQWVNIAKYPVYFSVCVFLSPPSLLKDYIRSVEWMFSFQTIKTSLHLTVVSDKHKSDISGPG
jgi:hypothetical protein